jgi:chromosome segregation ATPase
MKENQISENDFNLFSQPDPEMKSALADLWDTAANLVSSLKSVREENHNLLLKVSELEKLYVEIEDKDKLLNRIKELEAVEANLAFIHDDLAQKNHELNNKAKEILDLKNNSSLLESKIIELETENNKLDDLLEKIREDKGFPVDKDIIKYKQDIENYKSKLASKEKVLEDYESQLFDLKLKNNDLANSLKESKDSGISLSDEISSLRIENVKLKKEITKLDEFKESFDSREQVIEDYTKQIKNLNDLKFTLENSLEEVSNKCYLLEKSLSQMAQENDSLKKELQSGSANEKEFDFYKQQLENYQNQVKTANNELILKNNKIKELQDTIKLKEEEFNQKLSEEQNKRVELDTSLEQLSSEQKIYESGKRKISVQIDNYLVKLEKMLNQG